MSLKYAIRTLVRQPALTIAAVVMLAIGIGANTAMYSILRAVLLRPLGIDSPDRVVMIWPRNLRANQAVGELAFRDAQTMRDGVKSFDRVALLGSVNWGGTMRIGNGEPFWVPMNAVSASFFDVLGAKPMYGRTFRPDEDKLDAPRVLVLSHTLWVRRFNADPAVVGRRVGVKQARGEESFEIVGVMPPEFFFPRGAEYWTPAAGELASLARADKGDIKGYFDDLFVFYAIARLRPDAPLVSATAEGNAVYRSMIVQRKRDPAGQELVLTPVLDHVFGNAKLALKVLMGAVLVVLLIVCTNVASLLIARGSARRREIAVRSALGASRRRLIAQLLTESAVLALLGTTLGTITAASTLDVLVALSPADIPRLDTTSLDAHVMAFAGAIALITTMLLGITPAAQLTQVSLTEDLKGAAAGGTPRFGAARTRRALVGVQVAATFVLLVAAGLCVKSFERLNRLDLGFDPRNVLTFAVEGLTERYPDVPQRTHAVEQLLTRMTRLPHVAAAGAVSERPFEHGSIGMDSGVILEGQPVEAPDTASRNPMLNWEAVTPGYFRAMDIRLLRGRNFDERDDAASPLVVIVSEAMASRLWPGQEPLGKRILAYGARLDEKGQPLWQTVVGVVETARYRELESPRLDMYVPLRQALSFVNHFVVRTTTEPMVVAPGIRAEIVSFDGKLDIGGVTTMERIVARVKGPWRFTMVVFSGFAAVALALAALGLFALVAYAVTQRTREIGVRVALGAAPKDVVRLMLVEGAALASAGIVVGLLVAVIATRLIAGLLFAVNPTDPATFAAVTALLLAVTAVASYLPARRAASVDPLTALRAE